MASKLLKLILKIFINYLIFWRIFFRFSTHISDIWSAFQFLLLVVRPDLWIFVQKNLLVGFIIFYTERKYNFRFLIKIWTHFGTKISIIDLYFNGAVFWLLYLTFSLPNLWYLTCSFSPFCLENYTNKMFFKSTAIKNRSLLILIGAV